MKNKQSKLLWLFCTLSIGAFAYAVQTEFKEYKTTIQSYLLGVDKDEHLKNDLNATCSDPTNLKSKDIETNAFTIYWDDAVNIEWEYFVQEEGIGLPDPTKSTGTTSKVNKITVDNLGNSLDSNTIYEFFVRSKCGVDFGAWIGPISVRTSCDPFATFPFLETFNSSSTSTACWTVINSNKEASSLSKVSNKWNITSSSWDIYEGDGAANFSNFSPSDDWLITPALTLKAGGIYEFSYYYKTNTYSDTEFEVLLSDQGIATDKFTHTIVPKSVQKVGDYTKKTYYLDGYVGDIYIAWHVTAKGSATLLIDNVSVEEVDCVAPENIVVEEVNQSDATISFTDSKNTSWQYYVQLAGGNVPTGVGNSTTSKTIVLDRTMGAGGTTLQPNTVYEVYIRSNCGPGKFSKWVGPIEFTTLCSNQSLPFWEGFNTNSDLSCWRIVDNNNDFDGFSKKWIADKDAFEGNQSMSYNNNSGTHDDYLITPDFILDATKVYRLKYHFKTGSNRGTFKVLMSDKGIKVTDFDKELVSEKNILVNIWTEKKIIISGVGGRANFAWHISSDNGSNGMYVDNVFLEEVSCVDPIDLKVDAIGAGDATLSWTDNHSTSWEYFVQPIGRGVPKKNGTATTTKSVKVTTDYRGRALESNEMYEFYVRTVCDNGEYSDWSGPVVFTTACSILNPPFWEGFNTSSTTLNCWNILDLNGDVTSSGDGKWQKSDKDTYEGNGVMKFNVYDYTDEIQTDDWLISPMFTVVAGKTYRLSYKYKGSSINPAARYEVLGSSKGSTPADFSKTLLADQKLDESTYKGETIFITGISGSFTFAWRIMGTGSMSMNVDDVVFEEVIGCSEPVELSVNGVDGNSANLTWKDNYGAGSWEYYVQKAGGKKPTTGTKGVASSSKTTNKVTTDFAGDKLSSNADYEFYVRTNCGKGEYSIWAGPFTFTTLCGVYATPFWDGINSDSFGHRCWELTQHDKSGSSNRWYQYNGADAYEGDGMFRYNKYDTQGIKADSWAISPAIETTTDTYVLKYHYKTDSRNDNSFEVLLSSTGKAPADFTQTLVAEKIYKDDVYREEVVFFTGVKGTIHIGWRATSLMSSSIFIDNFSVKKVENCPEPYQVKTSNLTSSGFDVSWKQYGTVAEWEVIVVNASEDATAKPIVTKTVTGNPTTTISGLAEGQGYTVYVRSKCSPNDTVFSDWSTGAKVIINVNANDDCAGAVNLPVNSGVECLQTVSGTFLGAKTSAIPAPTCLRYGISSDVWYEFTAKETRHTLSILNLKSLSGKKLPSIYGAIYNQSCGAITSTALQCFEFELVYGTNYTMFDNLIVGQKYYIRLGLEEYEDTNDLSFDLCLATPNNIKVEEYGTNYSVEDLVKKVLVDSNCDLVSNIKWVSGDQFGDAKSIGYFERNNTDFEFDKGIVLTNSGAKYISEPSGRYDITDSKNWIGDDDLQTLLNISGNYEKNWNATVLEFDFIPIVDSLKFDFIFASNEYGDDQCGLSDVFAFYLTDLTTEDIYNLAVVPNTKTPVSVTTIRDSQYNDQCGSSNEEFFGDFYGKFGQEASGNPMNFKGTTLPLTAKAKVVPGRKYHIKMAIADYADTRKSSAVFLKGGSFNLKNLDLGNDLLIETGNALCDGASTVIKSGIDADVEGVVLTWYKDGKEIVGENKKEISVSETGTYKAVAVYENLNCEVTGEVRVEIYPAIHTIVKKPTTVEVCRNVIDGVQLLDLTQVESTMFTPETKMNYKTTYLLDSKEGEVIDNPASYKSNNTDKEIFILVEDINTGCSEYFSFAIKPIQGNTPEKPENVVACSYYTLPMIKENEHYYTEKGGKGTAYKSGDVLEAGDYTMYLLSDNGNGCYEEVSFSIKVTARPILQELDDVEMECAYYVLPDLLPNNKYFIDQNGQRIEVMPGTTIYETGTIIYIVAESADKLCREETSFTITYLDCPIPKGFSPNGDGINDTFDLSNHGVSSIKIFNRNGVNVYTHGSGYTKQWDGKDKSGNQLPSGTYYYVIEANHKTRTGWVEINR